MSKEAKPKKHRHKRHYTFLIVSSDSDGKTKSFHLDHKLVQLFSYCVFAIVLAVVCYIVFSIITMNSYKNIQSDLKAQIEQLIKENDDLTSVNEKLQTESLQLSAAINKRLVDEQTSAEEAESLAIPSGFPLTGTASMTAGVDDLTATTITEITDENKDEAKGNPIVLFTVSEGSSIIASGTGTVLSVASDTKFGNVVTIDHGNGYISIYRNGSDPLVSEGAPIDRGDIIFVTGKDSTSLGYQIQQDGEFIDPEDLIEING